MPVTLAQAQINCANDVDYMVIDNLRRYGGWLIDQIVFDDTATPGTGGGTLSYTYTRLTSAAPADFRAYNTEYTPGQAQRSQTTVNLKPLGGTFTIDRALSNLGPQATNEVNFQLQQLITSVRTRFAQEVIVGDTAVNANGFDGLDKLLSGTTTDLTTATNWTTGTINTQALANAELDKLDEWLSRIVPSHVGSGDQGQPGALPAGVKCILGNTKSIMRLKALARWAALNTSDKDDLGRQVDRYGDWVLVDLGNRADGSTPIIPISSNTTTIYAVTFGLDSFHGASVANSPLVQTFMPDFAHAGAVKSGEVEMGPLAMCLKNTLSAGSYRNITVQ